MLQDDSSSRWRMTVFGILLTGEVLCIPCYLFLLCHFIREKTLRTNLQNHSIILLLIYNFIQVAIDLSMYLDFCRHGYYTLFYIPLCYLQAYVDFAFWYGALHIMCWISIERHLFIFHSNLLRTTRQHILFHYIPLGFASIYAPVLYFYLIILYPCKPIYDPYSFLCAVFCYNNLTPEWFPQFELIANYILPIVIIAVFSCSLFIRVLIQKRRLKQAIDWGRQRKMIIQLVLVSMIYLAFYLPFAIAYIIPWFGISFFNSNTFTEYALIFTYTPGILISYANLLVLPQLKQKFRAIMFWKKQARGTVVPFRR